VLIVFKTMGMENLNLPSARSQAPLSPRAVKICFECKEEIDASGGGIVCIRKNNYHPRCVRCYKCNRQCYMYRCSKQVDGSILDGHGRMACVDCARKLSDASLKNEQRCQVIVKHSPKDTSIYDKEMDVKDADLSEFEKSFMDNHNTLRFKHAVKPLTWSNKLTAKARAWAIHLIAEQEREKKRNSKAKPLKIHTSTNDKGFGQTCCIIPAFARPTATIMADKVCDQWYSSGKEFKAEDNTFIQEAAPFTQMVWRESSKLGACLMWYGEMAIIVANYYPAGNYEQEFIKNVTNYQNTSPRRAGV